MSRFTMEFRIEHEWNSTPVSHDPVTICLKPSHGGLHMDVIAPFFNDPPAPSGPAGEPFDGLWDYEVVEAFFLNSEKEHYLEVELGPHGHHLVLLLSQRRNIWKACLPLSFQASTTEVTWRGTALLPWEYFPPTVDRFNAYAIHGSGLKRTYEALYPVPEKEVQVGQQPDLDFTLRTTSEKEASKYPEKQLIYEITTTWDSKQVLHEPVTITFKPHLEGLLMEVNALFFNDPSAPPGEPGKPFNGLWDYEVVESFFLNSKTTQYLEVELCPHGQHLVLLLSGVGNAFKTELPLEFEAETTSDWGKWHGSALIPWSYFPPDVNMMNSYAIHGSGIGRVYESLYPIPPQEISEGQGPNFHRLEYFKAFDLKWIMGEEWEQPSSSLWESAP
ncbi:UPF0462 protein C4orf33 homolog isoform X3 [Pseudophryne corroboree]|uniref:UPF0462 protein C4orf33 homolog isoform X3 n=1 Tax=Pseudophryne corroboree TaxID=495146 RepID=UPI0030814951